MVCDCKLTSELARLHGFTPGRSWRIERRQRSPIRCKPVGLVTAVDRLKSWRYCLSNPTGAAKARLAILEGNGRSPEEAALSFVFICAPHNAKLIGTLFLIPQLPKHPYRSETIPGVMVVGVRIHSQILPNEDGTTGPSFLVPTRYRGTWCAKGISLAPNQNLPFALPVCQRPSRASPNSRQHP
jgi:hypothetical protein